MAYNLSNEDFLKRLITDPDWCLFYQRSRVKEALPYLAKAYITIDNLQSTLAKSPWEAFDLEKRTIQ